MSRESIFDDVFDMILSPMDFMMRPEIRPERGPFVQIPKEFKDNMPLSMPLDLIKTDTGIKVKIALAGVKKEDIDLRVKDDILTVKVKTSDEIKKEEGNYIYNEIRTGSSARSINIAAYKAETIKSKFVDGILEITMDKKEPPTDEETHGVKINIE